MKGIFLSKEEAKRRVAKATHVVQIKGNGEKVVIKQPEPKPSILNLIKKLGK